jgi:hypothetical protein
MTVYLGSYGLVALTRKATNSGEEFNVPPSSINTTEKRFKLTYGDGADVTNVLITGDRVTITRVGSGNLDFVDETGWSTGTKAPSGTWYVYVDELGSIRLFTSLPLALEGAKASAVALDALGSAVQVTLTVKDNPERILGQVASYELNTAKEAIDTTVLSDSFRSQYSGLMSGSGQLTAFWDFNPGNGNTTETPNYLLQLALRTEIGGEFSARLFLKQEDTGSGSGYASALYYAFDAVITNAAVQLTADAAMQATMDFVTTGPIRLLLPTPTDEILIEGGFKLLSEDGTTSLDLELPLD